jgi:hypothetical protein
MPAYERLRQIKTNENVPSDATIAQINYLASLQQMDMHHDGARVWRPLTGSARTLRRGSGNANGFMQLPVVLRSFVEFISPSGGQIVICVYLCFHQVARKDVKSERLQKTGELFASQRRRLPPENASDNFGLLDRDLDSIIGDPLLCCFKC